MRLKTADASGLRPAARAQKAGGRSFAGHGARQDFPFFLVRNNRRFAGKDKFPFLARTVVFLQARRGGERRIWATRRERNGRAAQQGRFRPERPGGKSTDRPERGRAGPGKRERPGQGAMSTGMTPGTPRSGRRVSRAGERAAPAVKTQRRNVAGIAAGRGGGKRKATFGEGRGAG